MTFTPHTSATLKTISFLAAIAAILLAASSLGLAAEPHGRIGDKYAKLGGATSPLGPAIGEESDAPYGGRFHLFRNGMIFWHPDIGEAFAVWGAISTKYWEFGRAEFGYPITDELTTPDGRGRYNHFRIMQKPGRPEASIYWTRETGAHEIEGAIRSAWAQSGWEQGTLGYPTSDEFQDGPDRRSNFEHGYILWSQEAGARIRMAGGGVLAQLPPNAFRPLLVNGMEVALKNQTLAMDPLFLSENTVCGAWNAHVGDLNAFVQAEAIAQVNARLYAQFHRRDFGLRTSGTHVNLSHDCSFRADVLQACQGNVALHLLLKGNSFQFYVMTPVTAKDGVFGDSDPKLNVQADIDIATSIMIPGSPSGSIGFSPTTIRLLNVKLDSHNVTGDVVIGAAAVASEYFTGQNIINTLSKDRVIRLDGISTTLNSLTSAARKIPASYHLESCIRSPDIFRINGTDQSVQGPIVK